jgi:hypothetical protein
MGELVEMHQDEVLVGDVVNVQEGMEIPRLMRYCWRPVISLLIRAL